MFRFFKILGIKKIINIIFRQCHRGNLIHSIVYNQIEKNSNKEKIINELYGLKFTEFKSNYQELFNHMHNEHGLILVESEMDEIIHIVNKIQK